MTPLNERFSYIPIFPVAEEDLRQYLHDPVAALPVEVCGLLPKIGIVLAPYLVDGALSCADISLLAYTRLAHEGGFDIAKYPAVKAWVSRVEGALTIMAEG